MIAQENGANINSIYLRSEAITKTNLRSFPLHRNKRIGAESGGAISLARRQVVMETISHQFSK